MDEIEMFFAFYTFNNFISRFVFIEQFEMLFLPILFFSYYSFALLVNVRFNSHGEPKEKERERERELFSKSTTFHARTDDQLNSKMENLLKSNQENALPFRLSVRQRDGHKLFMPFIDY